MKSVFLGEINDITNFISDKYLWINSCGTSSINMDYSAIRSKGRVDFHILFLAKGKCKAIHNKSVFTMLPGNFLLYFPEEYQEYSFKKNSDSVTYWIHFSGTEVYNIFKEINVTSGCYFCDREKDIIKIFERIITDKSFDSPLYNLSANSQLLKLITLLFSQSQGVIDNKLSRYMEKTVCYLNLNYQRNLSVTELAKNVNLSESRFLHLFKKSMGISVKKYLTRIRLEKSKELLSDTDMQISDVAAAVGYNDSLYFSRIFKANVGISPSEFRDLNK